MYPINHELPKLAAEVKINNILSPYLPIATNRRNMFSWNSVEGLVLSDVLSKRLGDYSLDQYREECRIEFMNKLDDASFWLVIDEMYFNAQEMERVTPEFSLFQATESTRPAERIAAAFSGLLHGYELGSQQEYSLSFIETLLYETLINRLEFKETRPINKLTSYLPYLSLQFQQDLKFILSRPVFLNDEFQHFLKLYGFLYITQLALNIGGWREGEPRTAKPLYFITDTEKASGERQYIMHYGYKSLREALAKLFPILSLSEVLQPVEGERSKKWPLWMLTENVANSQDREQLVHDLSAYAKAFKAQRKLKTEAHEKEDPLDWIETLVDMAVEQFSPGRSRFKPNMEIVDDIEEKLCDGFIQVRGRAGKTLVLSQDYIVLLTNLTIGDAHRLRLHELLEGYAARGVFFDKLSEQALMNFFERIGNVDRMSDSGDAVYVRKTI